MGKGIKSGGGAENLKAELQEQDVLIEDILETIVGKSNGATATEDTILDGYSAYVGQELVTGKYLPHGNYVWKKGFNVPDETVNLQFSWLSNNQVQLNRTGIPLSDLIGWEFIKGVTITNDLFFFDDYDGGTSYGYKYDENSGILTSNSATAFQYKQNATYKTKPYVISGTFTLEEYVVSDDAEKYPNGGTQNEYWYEAINDFNFNPKLFGYSKVAVDKFTLETSSIANTVTLTHSLGKKPRFVFIHGNPVEDGVAKYYLISVTGVASPNEVDSPRFSYSHVYGSGGSFGNAVSSADGATTASTIVIPLQQVYQANVEYTLITMA